MPTSSPGPRPRPRDRRGRPLPPGRPDELGDGDPAASCTSAAEARERLAACLAEGRHFATHRVVLRLWRDLDVEAAALWQAVAQLTAGAVHLERGNRLGARTLLARAAERLADPSLASSDVDVAALARAAAALAADVGAGSLPAPRLPAGAVSPRGGAP